MGCKSSSIVLIMVSEEFYSNTLGMEPEEKMKLEADFIRHWGRLPKKGEWSKYMKPIEEER